MIRRLSATIIENKKAKRREASNLGLAQDTFPPSRDGWDANRTLFATQDRQPIEISLNGDGEC